MASLAFLRRDRVERRGSWQTAWASPIPWQTLVTGYSRMKQADFSTSFLWIGCRLCNKSTIIRQGQAPQVKRTRFMIAASSLALRLALLTPDNTHGPAPLFSQSFLARQPRLRPRCTCIGTQHPPAAPPRRSTAPPAAPAGSSSLRPTGTRRQYLQRSAPVPPSLRVVMASNVPQAPVPEQNLQLSGDNVFQLK